jgi:hypothetical protein
MTARRILSAKEAQALLDSIPVSVELWLAAPALAETVIALHAEIERLSGALGVLQDVLNVGTALAREVGAMDVPGRPIIPGHVLNMVDDILRASEGKPMMDDWKRSERDAAREHARQATAAERARIVAWLKERADKAYAVGNEPYGNALLNASRILETSEATP